MKNQQKIFPKISSSRSSSSHIFLTSSSHLLLLFLIFQSLFSYFSRSQPTSDYLVTTFVSSSSPASIAISPFNEMIYITETGTNRIRVVNRTSLSSSLSGISISSLRDICLSNISPEWGLVTSTSGIISQIYFETNSVVILAGLSAQGMVNGQGTNAKFNYPFAISLSSDDSYALVADFNNHLIRKITMATAFVETFAGKSGSGGIVAGIGTNAQFNGPVGVAISPDGTFALVVNYDGQVINKIILLTAEVSILAGVAGSSGSANGFGTNAQFKNPFGLAISPAGDFSVVGDYSNNQVRLIHISTSEVATLAGTGSAGNTNGAATSAQFKNPRGVAISSQAEGSYVLVADISNSLIRKISPTYTPTSIPSGEPSSAPSVPPITRFSFGVKIGDGAILNPGKAILVDYLQDARRGQTLPPLPLSVIVWSHFVPGKMIPISRVVNASLVSSASDPPLSSDSILIKWRPVTTAGIGSWDNGGNHIMTPGGGGVLVSWLVSLLSEEIKGFIVQGLSSHPIPPLPHPGVFFRSRLLNLSHPLHPVLLLLPTLLLRSWHLGVHLSQPHHPLVSRHSRVRS
jgi:DNA-binding beta-propeller fold protein YncE